MLFDQARNDLIFDDFLTALEAGRSPLLLTERTEHLELLAGRLELCQEYDYLKGRHGKKATNSHQRSNEGHPGPGGATDPGHRPVYRRGVRRCPPGHLFLVMPISWRGTLQQYVGRLHRLHDNKRVVQVYDYVDKKVPMLMRMYNKRLIGYKALGYKIEKLSGLHQIVPFTVVDRFDLYRYYRFRFRRFLFHGTSSGK